MSAEHLALTQRIRGWCRKPSTRHHPASLAVSGQTVARYIDILSDLMLVRAPKVYVRDSGIVHALLGLGTLESVLSWRNGQTWVVEIKGE